MPKAAELKTNMVIVFNGEPHIIRQIQTQSPSARGSATLYKMRLNHAASGQKVDHAFKGDDMVEEADFQRREVQYLFKEGDEYTFMDAEDYSQYALNSAQIENLLPYLIDQMTGLTALLVDGNATTVTAPDSVVLTIEDTPPAMKGSSQSARSKTAQLSTGLEVQVPEFLSTGDAIRVNTSTAEYMSRA